MKDERVSEYKRMSPESTDLRELGEKGAMGRERVEVLREEDLVEGSGYAMQLLYIINVET